MDTENDTEEQENVNPEEERRSKRARTAKKPREDAPVVPVQGLKKKPRTRKCTPQLSERNQAENPGLGVLRDVSNTEEAQETGRRKRKDDSAGLVKNLSSGKEEEETALVKNKRRKSYSLEDGGSRYSLDGSRRNR